MPQILSEILQSDLLLFRFPLYCYGMPAPFKALIDRTVALFSMTMQKVGERYAHVGQADYSKLRYLMICGCCFPNAAQFRLMFGSASPIVTVSEAPMFNAPEAEAVTKPFLETVRTAGREYAQTGCISDETMAKLAVPMIPDDLYARICNGEH